MANDSCNGQTSELVKAAEDIGQGKNLKASSEKLLNQFVGMKPEEAFAMLHQIGSCSGRFAGGGSGGRDGQSEGIFYTGTKGHLDIPALNVEYKHGVQTVTVGSSEHPIAQKSTKVEK